MIAAAAALITRRLSMRFQHRADSTLWVWQVAPHDVPNAWQVNAKVIVNDHVSKGSDAGPIHLRVLIFQRIGQSLRGFGEGMQIA